MDYPSVSLYNGILVYNTSVKDAKKGMISQVVAVDLVPGKKMLLDEIAGFKQYLGAPGIYENYVLMVPHERHLFKHMKKEKEFIFRHRNSLSKKLAASRDLKKG